MLMLALAFVVFLTPLETSAGDTRFGLRQKQQPDVTGQWDVTLRGRREMRFALLVRKEGDKLVATLIAPNREKRAATIEQAGRDITIRFELDDPGAQVPVVMTGTVDGRDMQGTADIGGKATAPWTARRRY